MNGKQSARLLIDATPDQVRAVLLEPLQLPEWNPAFLHLTGPAPPIVDQRYPITVRPRLSGHFSYTSIETDRIEMRWDVPGFTETASWQLAQRGNRTRSPIDSSTQGRSPHCPAPPTAASPNCASRAWPNV